MDQAGVSTLKEFFEASAFGNNRKAGKRSERKQG
jgi:hypothetical protein